MLRKKNYLLIWKEDAKPSVILWHKAAKHLIWRNIQLFVFFHTWMQPAVILIHCSTELTSPTRKALYLIQQQVHYGKHYTNNASWKH